MSVNKANSRKVVIPIGYEFGDRVVIAELGQIRDNTRCFWLVRCRRCGTDAEMRGADIKRKPQCNECRKRRMASPTWRSWSSMRTRCLCVTANNYPKYGGRGIQICQRWLDSYEAFLADMGPRPEGTTLDRIDNSKGYESGNCRWATPTQQTRNRSNTKLTPMLARAIRLMSELGYSQTFVGRRFRVAPSLVCQIKQGKIWRDA